MSSHAISLQNILKSDWLWTWSGQSFGYRRGASLFTYDGAEVGRFVDAEIYGVDGKYLGELKRTEDGDRLITSSYKGSRVQPPFLPNCEQARPHAPERLALPLYCGHEDFPLPEVLSRRVLEQKTISK